MKAPITREELKRRLMERGGISPDDAENAAVMDLFDEIDQLRSGKPKQQQGKTVMVKVAVAVDKNGHWMAVGAHDNEDRTSMDTCLDFVEDGEARYWLTAELPVPEEVTVEAEVHTATTDENATSGGRG